MLVEVAAEALVRRYFDDVNTEDWSDFRGIWHADAEIDVVGGQRVRGLDEIMAYYPRILANFPVHHDDPYGVYVSGDVVTVEIAFEGETASGVRAAWEAVDVFHLVDGRVKRLTTWYGLDEVVAFLRQPGDPARRLARVLAEAGVASLADVPPTRQAPTPKDVRVVLPGGAARSRGDWEESVRLWGVALAVAGLGREDVVAAHVDPGLADAAGRARIPVAVDAADATATLDVLWWPATGPVAAACGRDEGHHVLADGHHVEIEDGELLVTPLGGRTALLRYAPGVRAAWIAGGCRCGNELPRLEVQE